MFDRQQQAMTFGEAETPAKADAVATFRELVDAADRRDIPATIKLRRVLLQAGWRVEPVAARNGGGR